MKLDKFRINNLGNISIGDSENEPESKLQIYNSNMNNDSLKVIGNCKIGSGLNGSNINFTGGAFMIQNKWSNIESKHYINYPEYCIGDNSAGTLNIQISNKLNKIGNLILSFIKDSSSSNTNIFVIALQKSILLNTLSAEVENNNIIINTDNDCSISWTSQGSI